MSNFKVIETQEEFDMLISDRIARAEKATREETEKSMREKFADYDQVKKQNEDFAKQIATLTNATKEYEAKSLEASKTIEDLNAQIKRNETDSAKTRITLELGLPYEMAKRLNGSTEDEIRQDAESLLEIVGRAKTPAPAGTTEPDSYGANSKEKALMDMAKNLKF